MGALHRLQPNRYGPSMLIPSDAWRDNDLSSGAFRLLVALISYDRNGKHPRYVWPSAAALAQELGVSEITIKRWRKELRDRHYITYVDPKTIPDCRAGFCVQILTQAERERRRAKERLQRKQPGGVSDLIPPGSTKMIPEYKLSEDTDDRS